MSDPVTNVEIEDVLSSIRRLVSEGDKARHGPDTQDPKPEQDKPAPTPSAAPRDLTDKLVLTPALRVAVPETEETPATTGASADGDSGAAHTDLEPDATPHNPSLDPPAPSDRASLEATIAELEAAVVNQNDEWEPDGSEVAAKTPHALGLVIADNAEDEIAPDDSADLMIGWTSDVVADENARDADDAKSDHLIFPEDSVALPRDHGQRMSDFGAATEEAADDDAADDALKNLAAAVTEATIRDTADDVMLTLVPDAPWPQDRSAEEAVTEVEAEATDATEETLSDATVAFRHLASPDASDGRDLTGHATVDEDETLEAFLARGGGVDEEALRVMVMDIVRSELQGPLGERITRNVRKLVRREIMRVLNAQDMD